MDAQAVNSVLHPWSYFDSAVVDTFSSEVWLLTALWNPVLTDSSFWRLCSSEVSCDDAVGINQSPTFQRSLMQRSMSLSSGRFCLCLKRCTQELASLYPWIRWAHNQTPHRIGRTRHTCSCTILERLLWWSKKVVRSWWGADCVMGFIPVHS